MDSSDDSAILERKLGYQFRSRRLLQEALSHPSFGHERRLDLPDNQRLEFLGDAVLQLLSSDWIFSRHTDMDEGGMTRTRAGLVSRTSMCTLAEHLKLGEHLILGRAEENNGGRTRQSNLADAMEAIIGAVYLDGGWPAAEVLRETVLIPYWNQCNHEETTANPKGSLQEVLQALSPDAILYKTIEAIGPDHDRVFTVEVGWKGRVLGNGSGRTKKEAEANAAANALRNRSWL